MVPGTARAVPPRGLCTPPPQTPAVPPPPQTWGEMQLPQVATVRALPQLSVVVKPPQFLPSRVQMLASLSGLQVAVATENQSRLTRPPSKTTRTMCIPALRLMADLTVV